MDGATRDVEAINNIEFPLFCKGICPYDSKGRLEVIDYRAPIVCGNVFINHGDLVFADMEGIAIIPKGMADQVIDMALKKVNAENIVRDQLKAGRSAKEVYDEYGVL